MSSRARPNIRHLGLGVCFAASFGCGESPPSDALQSLIVKPVIVSSISEGTTSFARLRPTSASTSLQPALPTGPRCKVGLQRHPSRRPSHRAGGRWLLEDRQRQQRQRDSTSGRQHRAQCCYCGSGRMAVGPTSSSASSRAAAISSASTRDIPTWRSIWSGHAGKRHAIRAVPVPRHQQTSTPSTRSAAAQDRRAQCRWWCGKQLPLRSARRAQRSPR